MFLQVARVRIGKLPFDCLFQPDALDQLPAGHHSLVVERAYRERAPAQLIRHRIDRIEGSLTLTHINRKAHPIR